MNYWHYVTMYCGGNGIKRGFYMCVERNKIMVRKDNCMKIDDEYKYSYNRYDKCKTCKHKDEICDCTMYKPLNIQIGLFYFDERLL